VRQAVLQVLAIMQTRCHELLLFPREV